MSKIELNKKGLADQVAEQVGLTKKDAAAVVDAVFASITETLAKGGEVDIYGFGKFEVKSRAARNGINPITKEKIEIKSSKVPSFKSSKSLKEAVK
ncbi:MAG: HU family DNA-binding protein [Erysipelotrichaceae bacterium]|nr:HU family DNA-binding protein [Erysipelotrichaceae bacterium]